MDTQFSLLEPERLPSSGSARIGLFWRLPDVLHELGVDLHELLEAAAMRPDLFESRENQISYPDLVRLFNACETRTNCDHIALLAAERTRLADTGFLGQVACCGETVGHALRRLADHLNLQGSPSTVGVVTAGGFARVVYAVTEQGMTDTRHIQLAALVVWFNILQDLCGTGWLPTVVTVAIRGPSNPRPCQKFFRAPLRFDSDESAIHFERQWLDRPLPPMDPLVRHQVEAGLRARRASILADFPDTVRRILRRRLLIGECSMDAVAALLGMHRRTLDRQLQRHGVRYGELAESVRKDLACQLLVDTDMKVQRVAESLRFSSAANFATAFRRWVGVTPSEFRRRAG